MYYSEADYTQMFVELGFNLPRRGYKGMVSCPLHKDTNPSMSINLQTGLFNCFSCGYHGRIDKEYFKQTGRYFNNKSEYNSVELKKMFRTYVQPRVLSTKKNFFKATCEKYETGVLKDWLKYRGIKPSVADTAGVFYGAVTITYLDEESCKEKSYTVHDRIMFPVYDSDKKLCSMEMRFPFFGTENKKFKESVKKVLYPKCSTVNLLYEQYKLNKTKKLYVLEGLMDCLAFRSLTGIENSTSIFGANITEHQKELLNQFPEVCYVYNNDVAGLKSLESMRKSYKGKFTELKPAGDFDDVGDMAKAKFTGVSEWLKTEH